MKFICSDYNFFLKLNTPEIKIFNPIEVYKGCSIMAVNGHRSTLESQLNPIYENLLELRRKIFFGHIESAQNLIKKIKGQLLSSKIEYQIDSPSLLKGDLELLSGIISTIKGDYKTAGSKMRIAASHYEHSDDYRRVYKSIANEHICINNALSTYQSGELYSLSKKCLETGYFDVAGNISKSYALELLSSSNLPSSIIMAQKAQEFYLKECFIDDQMIAKSIEAIGEALLQNWQTAKKLYFELNSDMFSLHRKTQEFYHVLKDLLEGKKPEPSSSHPLSRVPWKKLIIKTGSLKMKLLELLREKPLSRDELIIKIWGENATHESYNQRFHSLIKDTRTASSHLIHFDGELYSLL